MKKLPIDKEERIKVLSDRIASYSDIELLANERRVYFIVDQPIFVHKYFEDGQIKSERISVQTFFFNRDYHNGFSKTIQREYQNGRLFVFYSLRENMLRGAFIHSDSITEDRGKRIDEILS